MNARKSNDPRWIGVLCRVYSGALWLYPTSHRKRWGDAMRQAFRDRCREAVREGRGPLNVLFAELLPDLAKTVGSEHVDAIYLEVNPMKRLLYVLIAAFFAMVLLRPDVSPAVDKVHGWWRQREELAYDRAYSAHLEALAQAAERQRQNADDDVTTAILYRDATQGRALYYQGTGVMFEGAGILSEAIGSDASKALLDRADAAFARALKADDLWALSLAVRKCPARPSVCARDASLARLKALNASNGAVWAYDLADAHKAGDEERSRSALAHMAQSTRFDTHNGRTVRALLMAFDRVPPPSRLFAKKRSPSEAATEMAQALAYPRQGYLFDEYLELKPFTDFCRSSDALTHTQRQADCRAAGKLMAEQGELVDGYVTWMRNAAPGELDSVREAFRDREWRSWGGSHDPSKIGIVGRLEIRLAGRRGMDGRETTAARKGEHSIESAHDVPA